MSRTMSRISAVFGKAREQGRSVLVPYVTAGDPQPDVTVKLMHAMVESGADIIELGVPFSDPMADGPTIQLACERALAHNVSLIDVLGMVQTFRQDNADTPVVLMGYLNPIEVMGYERFAQRASEAGVDGLLIVDLPPEEAEDVLPLWDQYNLDPIFLLAPTSTDQRVKRITAASRGFVYYVSLKGVTGVKTLDTKAVAEKVTQLRALTDLPIGVGFGIRDAESAARVGKIADAVVVGSAIVNRIAENATQPEKIYREVGEFLAGLRQAMDQN